jgi:hypothetical protein
VRWHAPNFGLLLPCRLLLLRFIRLLLRLTAVCFGCSILLPQLSLLIASLSTGTFGECGKLGWGLDIFTFSTGVALPHHHLACDVAVAALGFPISLHRLDDATDHCTGSIVQENHAVPDLGVGDADLGARRGVEREALHWPVLERRALALAVRHLQHENPPPAANSVLSIRGLGDVGDLQDLHDGRPREH